MKKDTTKTKVVFRKYKNGEIIALFPEMVNGYFVCSYMHMGQHSDAEYHHAISSTNPATEEEYKDLYNELTNQVGYILRILKKAKVKYV